VVSFKPRLLYPGGKSPWYALSIKSGGAQKQYGLFGEEVQPTVWSLMTEFSWFLYFYEGLKNVCDGLGGLVWGDKTQGWQRETKLGNIVRITLFR
jgi:hypothetical protein